MVEYVVKLTCVCVYFDSLKHSTEKRSATLAGSLETRRALIERLTQCFEFHAEILEWLARLSPAWATERPEWSECGLTG